jgi:hypothetical protein
VTLVRLQRDLYTGAAVDAAVSVYEGFAALERADDPSHWVVRVVAPSPERERRIAGELGNYALGVTVTGRRR